MNRLNFTALGTQWVIESSSTISPQIQLRLAEFEHKYSRFIGTSFLNHISSTPGTYILDEDAQIILDTYFELYPLTGGLFTPLIGQNLTESGYDASYSLASKPLSSLRSLTDILSLNDNSLVVKEKCSLDFGGVGKGYSIDMVAKILEKSSPSYFYINAGGDILIKSDSSIEVALENPNDTTEAIGIANICNQSICASSGNRRNWGKFHHIINPNTKSSPQDIAGSWVVAANATIADSLATCLFLVSPDILQKEYQFEYLIVNQHQQISKSESFPAKLFS